MMDATKFHKIADELLDAWAEKLEDQTNMDVEYQHGILEVSAKQGDYVINKHEPTRQIWVSSPISGAAKFIYNEEKDDWFNRNDESLKTLLLSEFGNFSDG